MITSRVPNLLRNVRLLKSSTEQFQQKVRNGHHHWNYRTGSPKTPKSIIYSAEFVCGFTVWWILWHLWTEPGHIFGEFEYPDASQWSDAELGISDE